jgi:hypothetical protein
MTGTTMSNDEAITSLLIMMVSWTKSVLQQDRINQSSSSWVGIGVKMDRIAFCPMTKGRWSCPIRFRHETQQRLPTKPCRTHHQPRSRSTLLLFPLKRIPARIGYLQVCLNASAVLVVDLATEAPDNGRCTSSGR